MSWAKVTRGAQRRRRSRRKTQRRPFILLTFDFNFDKLDLFWFLTAHFETGASAHHLSRVYPTSISNFPISPSQPISLVYLSQPTWSRHITHSEKQLYLKGTSFCGSILQVRDHIFHFKSSEKSWHSIQCTSQQWSSYIYILCLPNKHPDFFQNFSS